MTASETVQYLQSNGFHLWIDGEQLLCAPRERLTEELRQSIRQNKPEIIEWLERRRKSSNRKLRSFYGAIAKRYSGADRDSVAVAIPGWEKRINELEEAYTQAWKSGRACRNEFIALRDHWLKGLKTV